MENPATHGKAEKIVRDVLTKWWDNQHADEIIVGLSLERQITDALRAEGMLKE